MAKKADEKEVFEQGRQLGFDQGWQAAMQHTQESLQEYFSDLEFSKEQLRRRLRKVVKGQV